MADQDTQRGAFWTSLPGILTGAAALITAISGLAIWHSNSGPPAAPAAVVQQAMQPKPAAAAVPSEASTSPAGPVGSRDWCAANYKKWADLKAQSGTDDAGLRKELVHNHCNQYGFVLGRAKPSQ